MSESPCEWGIRRPVSEAGSKILVNFPMFSCHVVGAGLDFLQILWHEQKHQNRLACGPKPPQLKSSSAVSKTSRNFSHRWKTWAEKASPTSTRPEQEQSYNSASAFAVRLARNPPSSKSIAITDFSWIPLRVRSRVSPSLKPLLPRLSEKNVSCKECLLPSKPLQCRRSYRFPRLHARR